MTHFQSKDVSLVFFIYAIMNPWDKKLKKNQFLIIKCWLLKVKEQHPGILGDLRRNEMTQPEAGDECQRWQLFANHFSAKICVWMSLVKIKNISSFAFIVSALLCYQLSLLVLLKTNDRKIENPEGGKVLRLFLTVTKKELSALGLHDFISWYADMRALYFCPIFLYEQGNASNRYQCTLYAPSLCSIQNYQG